MSEENHFKELRLDVLRYHAKKWVQRYPCIESVLLCQAGHGFESIPEDDNDVKYIIVVKAPPNPFSLKKNKDGSYNLSLEYKDIKLDAKIKELPTQTLCTESFPKLPRYPKGIVEKEVTFECHDATLEIKAIDGIDSLAYKAIQQYPKLEYILDYHNNLATQGSCEHIIKYIASFYEIKNTSLYSKRIDNWLWFTISPGEDILDYNKDVDEFVKENEQQCLYPCSDEKPSKRLDAKDDNPEKQLDDFLTKVLPEIEIYYKLLKHTMKKYDGIGAANLQHAKNVFEAENSQHAKNASEAENSQHAKNASEAENSQHAKNASEAENSQHAKNASKAENSQHAKNASKMKKPLFKLMTIEHIKKGEYGGERPAQTIKASIARAMLIDMEPSTYALSKDAKDLEKLYKRIKALQ
ncbi:MAG: hypothetical protein PHP23_04675 [Desulfobacterales bacterium]|nr:hypothetical protein [Desulfobacterales bacterium]MDD4071661.1 hypothetical protein [Desulfobacterales bacterium]